MCSLAMRKVQANNDVRFGLEENMLVENFRNRRFFTAILVAVFAMVPLASAQDATPIFDSLETNVDTKLDVDRLQRCLLGAKAVQHASTIDLIKPDSKKAVRATKSAPKLEALMRERAQTDAHQMSRLKAVKAEYDIFKAADKDEKKRLFKIAKNTNKACGRHVERLTLKNIGRYRKMAELVPEMSSETAELCLAVSSNSIESSSSLLTVLMQTILWSEVYKKEKRREGVEDSEIVETPKIKDSKAALKDIDKDRAMSLFKTCRDQFETASFEYKLTEPEEAPEFVSAVEWD